MSMKNRMTMVLALFLSVIGAEIFAQKVVNQVDFWSSSFANQHSNNTKANADNLRPAGKEEDCPTIDSLVLDRSYDALRECMMDIGGIQGQVAVIDARTSDVLAWGALENAEGDIAYAPLLKRFCSSEIFMPFIAADCLAQSNTSMEDSVDTKNGILEVNDSMCVHDHNFRRGGYGKLTYKQALLKRSRISMFLAVLTMKDGMAYWKHVADTTKNTNAMKMAMAFNDIYHLDSVNISAERRSNIRAIAIGMFKEGGIQMKYASKDVELAGMYHVVDDGYEQTFSFVGCFPADKPKYAVSMVVHRKYKLPASPAMVSDKVNKLIKWLDKR